MFNYEAIANLQAENDPIRSSRYSVDPESVDDNDASEREEGGNKGGNKEEGLQDRTLSA